MKRKSPLKFVLKKKSHQRKQTVVSKPLKTIGRDFKYLTPGMCERCMQNNFIQ